MFEFESQKSLFLLDGICDIYGFGVIYFRNLYALIIFFLPVKTIGPHHFSWQTMQGRRKNTTRMEQCAQVHIDVLKHFNIANKLAVILLHEHRIKKAFHLNQQTHGIVSPYGIYSLS